MNSAEFPSSVEMWRFLPWGYAITVLIELPVLWFGLSPRHNSCIRIGAAFWLTACTYPIVVLVLPMTVWRLWGYGNYLLIAEVFAPVAECLLFLAAWGRKTGLRDGTAVVAANLSSFLIGMGLRACGFDL